MDVLGAVVGTDAVAAVKKTRPKLTPALVMGKLDALMVRCSGGREALPNA